MITAVPAQHAFLRRLTSAQRRLRARVAFEAVIVTAGLIGLASAWGIRAWGPRVVVVMVLAVAWVMRPRGRLHGICRRFDEAAAVAGGGPRVDSVLCAYELADVASPFAAVVLQQGQQAAQGVRLHAVAPLRPRPYALALAAIVGMLTLVPPFVLRTHPVTARFSRGITNRGQASSELAADTTKAKSSIGIVSEAFKAAPALRAAGEAIAKADAAALAAAVDAVRSTLPTQAHRVAESMAIARHALAQQPQENAVAGPQESLASGDDSEAQAGGDSEPAATPDERTLEHLERGLSEAEDICTRDPQACADAVKNVEQELQPLVGRTPEAGKGQQAPSQTQTQSGSAEASRQGEAASTQAAAPNQQTTTAPGTSQTEPRARRSAGAVTGVATQDVAVDLASAAPDRAEAVQGARQQAEAGPLYRARLQSYRQRAEAVVAQQALSQERRTIVRKYFQELRPEQVAPGGTRD